MVLEPRKSGCETVLIHDESEFPGRWEPMSCIGTRHKMNSKMRIVVFVVGDSTLHVVLVWNESNDENGYHGSW